MGLPLALISTGAWGLERDPGAVPEAGIVLAVGGGGTPQAVIEEALERVQESKEGSHVLVIPYASAREDRGVGSLEMWLEAGSKTGELVVDDPIAAKAQVERSDIIWMSGGDQGRLLDDLERLGLVEPIRVAHARGAIVGGTSAGAAVLGAVCIAGKPDPESYAVGAMPGRAGLGLVPNAIVDQHFRERQREGRLLTAVLDGGGLVGYGISESTAVFFQGARRDVRGEGVVVVFDATDAKIDPDAKPNALRTASGIRTGLLAPPH